MNDYGGTVNPNREPLLPPVETDWPTIDKVQANYPDLCGEEHEWILEALIAEAHRRKKGESE